MTFHLMILLSVCLPAVMIHSQQFQFSRQWQPGKRAFPSALSLMEKPKFYFIAEDGQLAVAAASSVDPWTRDDSMDGPSYTVASRGGLESLKTYATDLGRRVPSQLLGGTRVRRSVGRMTERRGRDRFLD
ncbi:hypothetical protein BV898_16538 [Hypsibius exemplaris]|uniref:Pro-corazonin n=1 Tax=Hypsibius exemplaris TaxID=2072580 RepID=A0A9X6NDW4_HYPEX|nr:hypothetical protein BV898_16538 [Hypsibius exemplaris]